ncbi:MAG: DUF2194 domain-containing protein [Prevotellaceae bacterium]|nr:DUF2194 domain-containing protein [Prevotellaceae bacterium]
MKQANFKQRRCSLGFIGKVLVLAAVFSVSAAMQAQVTIGADEAAVSGALLQLKEKTSVIDDSSNAYKGLLLPRVILSDKHQLFPMFASDPASPNPTANADYSLNKTALDKSHTGLIVYNLVEDESKDLCKGLNQWDGTQWVCFQSKVAQARFDAVTCANIVTNGSYVQGTPSTSANYLRVTLNVTKVGDYTIRVNTKTENGYSFYVSGVATSTGPMTVNIPCQGTPAASKLDTLVFQGMTLATGCEPLVVVVPAIATYTMNCSSVSVMGTYQKGVPLNGSNMITLSVTATVAGSFTISTPLTNGIRFSNTAMLNVGTQFVNLIGSGTPTINTDFPITINSNSLSESSSCTTTIPVTLPPMTFAVITGSSGNAYGWDGSPGSGSPRGAALKTAANFGPNGKVKMVSFTQLWTQTDPATVTNNLNNPAIPQPDIVLFSSYLTAFPNADLISALVSYVDKGGCLIYATPESGTDNLNSVNALLSGIFNMGNIAQAQVAGTGTTDDNDYLIVNIPDDPIINGPFGHLGGQFYWGEDNASTGSTIVTALPPNSVQICSANNRFGKTSVNPTYSIVWYNKVKGFVYFGDSVGATLNSTTTDTYPSNFSSAYAPLSKMYGNYPYPAGSPSQFVYDSALELNAVAWALRKAATNGINSH